MVDWRNLKLPPLITLEVTVSEDRVQLGANMKNRLKESDCSLYVLYAPV